jgi:hypoxanthine phosphoribosyltransferase
MQKPEIIEKIRLDLKGLYLLLIDDILDSSRTLSHVTEIF